ncbi:MAG TPA: sugar phosphate isomerase/epimerase family protein [Armatimonadota bacterium]|nr:sugar phosphate isomerase/epimerase family protein [Armatimonadota bacterium]
MLGLSLAYLPGSSLREVTDTFLKLQGSLPLKACELHLEAIQFEAAFWYWDRSVTETVSAIRERVDKMGIHLPYLDLNPISPNPRLAKVALAVQRSAIGRSASLGADYVVFHARGRHGLEPSREREIECWQKVVRALSDFAAERGIAFYLENADDVRLIDEVGQILVECPKAGLCLDVGHLFERVEAPPFYRRAAKVMPSLVHKGVPSYEAGGLETIMRTFRDRIRCVHLHSHDGRTAHRPIAGKISLKPMIEGLQGIPMIVEADYRRSSIDEIRHDLALLERLPG